MQLRPTERVWLSCRELCSAVPAESSVLQRCTLALLTTLLVVDPACPGTLNLGITIVPLLLGPAFFEHSMVECPEHHVRIEALYPEALPHSASSGRTASSSTASYASESASHGATGSHASSPARLVPAPPEDTVEPASPPAAPSPDVPASPQTAVSAPAFAAVGSHRIEGLSASSHSSPASAAATEPAAAPSGLTRAHVRVSSEPSQIQTGFEPLRSDASGSQGTPPALAARPVSAASSSQLSRFFAQQPAAEPCESPKGANQRRPVAVPSSCT